MARADVRPRPEGPGLAEVGGVGGEEESIIIDGNHPLAGRDLVFDIEVIEIKEPVVTA